MELCSHDYLVIFLSESRAPGAGETAGVPVAPAKNSGLNPTPMWPLTPACNSNSRVSHTLFWLLWTSGMHVAYRHACRKNAPPSMLEAEIGGSGVHGQPQLHYEFEDSLGFVRPCLVGRRERKILIQPQNNKQMSGYFLGHFV